MRAALLASACFTYLAASLAVAGSEVPPRFDHLDLEQGLSQSTVTCILKDSRGFLWVGTEDGLNRYDGYGFTVFRPQPGRPGSLSNAQVWALWESRDGSLWVGTYGGLNRFDRMTETFSAFRHDPADPATLSSDFVRSVVEDKRGVVWVGTKEGLNRLEPTVGGRRVTRFLHDPTDPVSIAGSYVEALLVDSAGALWVGTYGGGIDRFDAATGRFEHHTSAAGDPTSLAGDDVRALWQDREGAIWVGTNVHGLSRLDPTTGRAERYRWGVALPGATSSNSVTSLCGDGEGRLWIATFDGGLNRLDPRSGQVLVLRHDPSDPHSLPTDRLRRVFVDSAGVVWVGTIRGLGKLAPTRATFAHLTAGMDDDPEAASVRALAEDRAGVVWVGTRAGLRRLTRQGIEPVEPQLAVDWHVRALLADHRGGVWVGGDDRLTWIDPARRWARPVALSTATADAVGRVWSLLEDRAGAVWVGGEQGLLEVSTWSDGPNGASAETTRIHLPGLHVRVLLEDRDGVIWAGTQSGGLLMRAPGSAGWVSFSHDPRDPASLGYPAVASLFQDRLGALWVGTYGGGLDRRDPVTGRFSHLTEADGLPNNVIYGILPDDSGRLWTSSNRGLSRLDLGGSGAPQIRSYTTRDGLQSLEFNSGAHLRMRSGRLAFGGINGINVFRPEEWSDDPNPPVVVLTRFQVFNRDMRPGETWEGRVVLQRSITETGELVLRHTDRVVSFEFAALHFVAPEANQYAYRLAGLERDWNVVGTRRYATYSNLPPGRYTFEVKAANPDGVWSSAPAGVRIVVTPPFWGTWWFRLGLGVLALASVLAVHRWRVHALEAHRRELEVTVAQRTEQLAQVASIVRSINSRLGFDELLKAILSEARAVGGVQCAVFLVRDRATQLFDSRVSINCPDDGGTRRMTLEEVRQRYLAPGTQVRQGLFLVPRARPRAGDHSQEVDGTPAVLAMTVEVSDELDGLLVLAGEARPEPFSGRDIELLSSLREHIRSAFIKARLLSELEELSDKKSEALRIAAHDLRNPVSAIISALQLTQLKLRQGSIDGREAEHRLERVSAIAGATLELLERVLDLSIIEAGGMRLELGSADLRELLVRGTAKHQERAAEKGIALAIEPGRQPLVARADAVRISQVVDNLISNALKFTVGGGSVLVGCRAHGNEMVAFVRDTGQGLGPEDLRQVFRSFKRLSAAPTGGEPSTGLGLAIAKGIVEAHGGRIWVESEKGEGSTFYFALPAA